MVDAVMDKTAYARLVIAAQAVGINNAVRHDFLFDNRHQSIGFGIIHHNGIDPSVAFQDAEDSPLSLPRRDRVCLYTVRRNSFRPARRDPRKPHRQPRPNDG